MTFWNKRSKRKLVDFSLCIISMMKVMKIVLIMFVEETGIEENI
jgi:hypothetical protein